MPERVLGRKQFVDAFTEAWGTDQHVSMIGPTGRGKSTVGRALVGRRKGTTIILCPKGPDRTLDGFGKVVSKWPPPLFSDTRPNKQGQRIIRLQPPLKRAEQFQEMRPHFDRAIREAFAKAKPDKPITIYVDELEVACHPQMMKLGPLIETVMVAGRSRGCTVLSGVQAPRWVPRATYDQAQHVLLWRQRDRESVKRISEISGADTREVQDRVAGLDYHELLWVNAVDDELTLVKAS